MSERVVMINIQNMDNLQQIPDVQQKGLKMIVRASLNRDPSAEIT